MSLGHNRLQNNNSDGVFFTLIGPRDGATKSRRHPNHVLSDPRDSLSVLLDLSSTGYCPCRVRRATNPKTQPMKFLAGSSQSSRFRSDGRFCEALLLLGLVLANSLRLSPYELPNRPRVAGIAFRLPANRYEEKTVCSQINANPKRFCLSRFLLLRWVDELTAHLVLSGYWSPRHLYDVNAPPTSRYKF
ncbi:NADPH oxidoreductase [Bombyx mori]|uniref:Uncharacterized protein n=2 Tax=Bombyx mori TaxID=7091 RepID=A0A8R1XGQ6_BOMMO|nr:NADPH oxidoreductase [Bombyx mori]